jgi:4,5-dihydroxyphthalate decarboxylase
MTKTRLTAVSRTQGNNRALKEGLVTLPDFDLDFEEGNPLPRPFAGWCAKGPMMSVKWP